MHQSEMAGAFFALSQSMHFLAAGRKRMRQMTWSPPEVL